MDNFKKLDDAEAQHLNELLTDSWEVKKEKLRADLAQKIDDELKGKTGTNHLYDVGPNKEKIPLDDSVLVDEDWKMLERVQEYQLLSKRLGYGNVFPGDQVSKEELAYYDRLARESKNPQRVKFLGYINNVLTGIYGQEELIKMRKAMEDEEAEDE